MNRDPKRQLEEFFRDELRLSRAEAPSFDDLAAYVEDRLDPEARALLEERIAADPGLRREVDDLRTLHAQMARPRRAMMRPVLFAALAAAAAVAAVAVTLWRRPAKDVSRPNGEVVTPYQTLMPVLKDGDLQVDVAADGAFWGLSSLDPTMRAAVTAALRGTLPAPRGLGLLQSRQETLMGSGTTSAFAPESPIGTRMGTDRPTFRWTAYPRATTYEVAVFDQDLQKQLTSGPIATTDWTPPTALARGRTYLWQVTALAGGQRVTAPAPPAPEARFEVAGTDVLAEVEKRRAQAPGSHLVAALALVEAGLLDDAESELDALATDNPGSPEVARLRESLAALRPARTKDPR